MNDVATHFRDRGNIIRLQPLSFSEFLPVSGMNEFQAWEEYLVYGGMPEAVLLKDKAARGEYLSCSIPCIFKGLDYIYDT